MSMTVHHIPESKTNIQLPDPHQDTYSKTILGFWMYLMSDCLLFATLFATYAVLHTSTFGGPSSHDIFSLSIAFKETMLLLFSSVTCGLAVLSSFDEKHTHRVLFWLAVTFILGSAFVSLEFLEFHELVEQGNDWTRSAFLSSFFTLVGTHGLHVSTGLLWILALIGQIAFQGIDTTTFRRLAIFSMFWHFLDLIWIFIFTLVYLMGVL